MVPSSLERNFPLYATYQLPGKIRDFETTRKEIAVNVKETQFVGGMDLFLGSKKYPEKEVWGHFSGTHFQGIKLEQQMLRR